MMASPFTFYRGAAGVMAADLEATPTAGLEVQLCGDAHLSNFGVFGSPERALVFDINDFDETIPGPFEYDVKRLAASLTVAAQNNGFSPTQAREITKASTTEYRDAMAGFAGMRTLDVWYAHISEEQVRTSMTALLDQPSGKHKGKKKNKEEAGTDTSGVTHKELKKLEKRLEKSSEKARSRNSLQALAKLAEIHDGSYRIASAPPVVVPARDLFAAYGIDAEQQEEVITNQFREYRKTLPPDRRQLLERFEVVDWARKVVGVGSVGTRAFIVLLQGRDQDDPLFLQVKEATGSVLEDHLPRSRYDQPGERVVQGQRMMQAASDIFLGWSKGLDASRHYYWRQLRDMKLSALVEQMSPNALGYYAHLCGWTLA